MANSHLRFLMNTTRVAITGSSGLSAAIAKALEGTVAKRSEKESALSFEVKFLRLEQTISCNEYDIFINNAHKEFRQAELLFKFFEAWRQDPKKLIINISSRAAQPNISKGYMYAAQKAALNHLAANLTFNSDKRCRIVTVNLGLMEHELSSLKHDEVANLISYIVTMPDHIEISDITIQHAANYQQIQREKEAWLQNKQR